SKKKLPSHAQTSVVFHWISSEELARRWISALIELRKSDSERPAGYSLVQLVNGHRVEMTVRIAREIPNQELDLLTSSGASVSQGFSGDANFRLIAGDDYTRLVFNSHTEFAAVGDRILEPVLTFAMRRKIHGDLAKLKILLEAE